jgi:MFS family permease
VTALGFLAQSPRVLATVARNPELRRVQLAFAAFNAAEWAVWIAMLVYAYEQGGATTAGVVALAQLAPAAIFAPFVAVAADRLGSGRVLALGYCAQAAAMAGTATVLLADGPPLAAYALAAVAATAVTATRPSQAALVPALARTPDELTATNVVGGWIESVSVLVAPAGAGVLLAIGSPGLVFTVMAVLALAGAGLVAPLARRPQAQGEERREVLTELAAGFRTLSREPEARLLVLLLGAQFVAVGALDVLYVVLAISVLDLGGSGAGYLNAAFGAGGVLGIAATAALVGRSRLTPPLVLALAVWSAALAAIGLWPAALGAFLLLAVGGAARSLFDVAGRTLLQRTAPPDVLARVFGVLEGLTMVGLAVGSLLAPALVALGGARAAFLGLAALLPLLALATARQLSRIDRRADVPVVELALLRSLPLFAPLPAPVLERLARSLESLAVPAGTVVVRKGEPGDLFYVVAAGRFAVDRGAREPAVLLRCDCFGEIALLADVPRTATVTAVEDSLVYALAREPFLEAVTGHASARRAADALVRERIATPAEAV